MKALKVILSIILIAAVAAAALFVKVTNVKTTKMTDRFLEKFDAVAPLTARDMGDYSTISKNGMNFHLRSYACGDLGYVSVIEMDAMLGLMKMDTMMFVPAEKDVPLYSCDRILAMGNDTLMMEMYNLCIDKEQQRDMSAFDEVIASLSDLKDGSISERWYDYLQLPQTFVKKAKNVDDRYVKAIEEYTDAYIEMLTAADECDREAKLKEIKFYVDGLFEKGSPTVEQFVKLMPKEDAYDLYRRFVFCSEPGDR